MNLKSFESYEIFYEKYKEIEFTIGDFLFEKNIDCEIVNVLVGMRKFYFKLKIIYLNRISPLSKDINAIKGGFGKVSIVPLGDEEIAVKSYSYIKTCPTF